MVKCRSAKDSPASKIGCIQLLDAFTGPEVETTEARKVKNTTAMVLDQNPWIPRQLPIDSGWLQSQTDVVTLTAASRIC